MTESDKQKVFEESDFLKLVWEQEDNCEAETDKIISNFGKKAPECLNKIGTVLSFLDRMASCWWVCLGKKENHQIEVLCGKVSSNGRGALRLLRFGFYDESLTLCRTIGEIANLLNLFTLDKNALKIWRDSSQNIHPHFSPVNVRNRIEKLQKSVYIDQLRYRHLSRVTHADPKTRPQSYNIPNISFLGAQLQLGGVATCLDELALALSIAIFFGARLLDSKHSSMDKEITNAIISSSIKLLELIEKATILENDEYYRQFRKSNNQ